MRNIENLISGVKMEILGSSANQSMSLAHIFVIVANRATPNSRVVFWEEEEPQNNVEIFIAPGKVKLNHEFL